MEHKKVSLWLIVLVLFIFNTFAVTVIQQNPNQQPAVDEGFRSIVITIFSIGIMGLLFVAGILLFAWVLFKIYKKLSEYNNRKKDFLYYLFYDNLMQCHFNHDKRLKKRNWKLLWLFWKRSNIYIEQKNGSLEVVGQYHGECLKKENFYMIAIYNKISSFKYIGQIILIPINLKDKIVKKIDGDKRTTLFLSCEGLDYVENTDYYLVPLIPQKDNEFLDLSDYVHNKFIEPSVYKDVIKENLLSYRDGIIKSVETNPFVHFGRRSDNFKK